MPRLFDNAQNAGTNKTRLYFKNEVSRAGKVVLCLYRTYTPTCTGSSLELWDLERISAHHSRQRPHRRNALHRAICRAFLMP